MRRTLSLAAAALVALAVALPAGAQETTPTLPEVGGAAAPAPTETAPAPVATTPAPTATAPTPTTTAPAPATTAAPDPAAAAADADDDGPSAWLVGLAVLVALSLLALLLWAILRLLAWEPAWVPAARHALGEAGYRTGSAWSEFRDWLRPKR